MIVKLFYSCPYCGHTSHWDREVGVGGEIPPEPCPNCPAGGHRIMVLVAVVVVP